ERGDLLLRGCFDWFYERAREDDVLDRTVFALVQRHRTQEGVGCDQPVRHRLDDLLAYRDLFAIPKVIVGRHADLTQNPFELRPVEATVGRAKSGVLCGEGCETVAGKAKAHFTGLLIEHGSGDQLR